MALSWAIGLCFHRRMLRGSLRLTSRTGFAPLTSIVAWLEGPQAVLTVLTVLTVLGVPAFGPSVGLVVAQDGRAPAGQAGLGALLAPPPAPVPAEKSENDRIGEQLDALAVRLDAVVAADAIARGREALVRAREALEMGHADAAERARQIAWSALSLATRQLARDHARREFAAAGRRVAVAEAERARVRAELAQVQRRLDALRREAAR